MNWLKRWLSPRVTEDVEFKDYTWPPLEQQLENAEREIDRLRSEMLDLERSVTAYKDRFHSVSGLNADYQRYMKLVEARSRKIHYECLTKAHV